ncbi:MAG: hypothetical protein AVDCRST_MAG75-1961, partial [uncultured Propionibacteriaceae bacterium]
AAFRPDTRPDHAAHRVRSHIRRDLRSALAGQRAGGRHRRRLPRPDRRRRLPQPRAAAAMGRTQLAVEALGLACGALDRPPRPHDDGLQRRGRARQRPLARTHSRRRVHLRRQPARYVVAARAFVVAGPPVPPRDRRPIRAGEGLPSTV